MGQVQQSSNLSPLAARGAWSCSFPAVSTANNFLFWSEGIFLRRSRPPQEGMYQHCFYGPGMWWRGFYHCLTRQFPLKLNLNWLTELLLNQELLDQKTCDILMGATSVNIINTRRLHHILFLSPFNDSNPKSSDCFWCLLFRICPCMLQTDWITLISSVAAITWSLIIPQIIILRAHAE